MTSPMMEAHLAVALNAKTMFSVKHLLDLHHHHHDSTGAGGKDAMRLQLSAAASGGMGLQTTTTSEMLSPTLAAGAPMHDQSASVVALMPEMQQLTTGGGGIGGGSSPVGFGVDVPDLAHAAVAMASCYDQDLNPYTRWLQSNASLDYYTGMHDDY